MLTIITPVYCQSKSDHIYERTLFFIERSYISEKIKRIIVDFGSLTSISEELERKCFEHNFVYVNLGMQGNPFSAGECRNKGVSMAKTEYVTFQDIDLYAPDSVYENLINRISGYEYYNEVECIPCLYLAEDFSQDYVCDGSWENMHSLSYKYYRDKHESIKMYAPVTSMIIIKRHYLMECGGNNTEFHGHGYEDFELLNRVANRSNKFVRSRDYYSHEYKYDSPYYNGYRTFFSLFGREAMGEKIFFVHLWHPENLNKNYSERNQINRNIFNKLIRKFDKEESMPAALTGYSSYVQGKTLVLAPKEGKTVNSIRVAMPYLSHCVYSRDTDFTSVDEFVEYLGVNSVSRVLFFNSYANAHRLELYNKCLQLGLSTINYDRGGLPDTWFFDPNGFNASSSSYSPDNWDKEISSDEVDNVSEFILKTLSSSDSLEKNGDRIGASNFIKKYHLGNKKVLFIPLQRPNDSVIRYFSDKVSSVDGFLEEAISLASMPEMNGWHIIIKKHPLESDCLLNSLKCPDNVTLLSDTENFCDAIISADAVMLINSGVGLYSIMAGKPTFNLGLAYYSHPGLSVKLNSAQDFLEYLPELKKPSVDKVNKFIHYLMNEFYSIGETLYKESINTITKSKTTNAVYTDFSVLRMPNDDGVMKSICLERRNTPFKINTCYYEYYRSGIMLRDKIQPPTSVKASIIENKKSLIDVSGSDGKKSAKLVGSGGTVTNNSRVISSENIKNTGKLSRKAKKLVKNPVLFFSDAFKNVSKNKSQG